MFLQSFPPMGVYETLFRFADATGKYMGDAGTHPWAQGFPLTEPLPGGPDLPSEVRFGAADLKYPTATGQALLREAIADYYNHFYRAGITADNVAVFAGGRPAIYCVMSFALPGTSVVLAETEYPPYHDALQLLGRRRLVVPSNESNRFRPRPADYPNAPAPGDRQVLLLTSHPCNPTGVTRSEEELAELVARFASPHCGAIFDEAYEFFNADAPRSALQYIRNLDESNFFIVGAATKGLQVPGMRIGWLIASQKHIEICRNFSSIAMGGVARPSQIYVQQLLELGRVTQARQAVAEFYTGQRNRYAEGLQQLGLELFSGNGGFYHWLKLPGGMTADEFNERLFRHQAAILPGQVCDMAERPRHDSPLRQFVRFSFGPLRAESYAEDMEILAAALRG